MKLLIIILALIGGMFPILLNLFKRKSSTNPLPENVRDVYDDETYGKWRNYNAEHSRLDLVSGIVTLILNLLMFATNLYSCFASLFPADQGWQIFAVILIETIIGSTVNLFFNYYSTMVIEEKYGFNKSTVKTFIIDQIRNLIISLVLGLLLAFLVFGLHSWLQDNLIILLTASLFLFSLFISFLFLTD